MMSAHDLEMIRTLALAGFILSNVLLVGVGAITWAIMAGRLVVKVVSPPMTR